MSDHYFNFPLAALHGIKDETTPLECMELAMYCGLLNAGIGMSNNNPEEFLERLGEVAADHEIERPIPEDSDAAYILVGANVCNVSLANTSSVHLHTIANRANKVPIGGAIVRMSSRFMWAGINQARAEESPSHSVPQQGISWREFRILCAILSVKINTKGFAFIGWETIQHRSCGYTSKSDYKAAERIPYHLQPPLSRKQIRSTCDTLENLGFYARFRMSSGSRGGRMAYSFRHDREELPVAVCDHVNFYDQQKIKANRAEDAAKCLQLLERAKSGPNRDQHGGQG